MLQFGQFHRSQRNSIQNEVAKVEGGLVDELIFLRGYNGYNHLPDHESLEGRVVSSFAKAGNDGLHGRR